MSTIETLESIDLSRIRWVKNIKRNKGLELAYFGLYENNEFTLHWPKSKAGNANKPNKGDYLILFQNYFNKGVHFTHIVEVVDDNSFIDETNDLNYQTGRMVKTLYRTQYVVNDRRFRFNFRKVAYGQAFPINLLNNDLTENAIKSTFLNLFIADYHSNFHIDISDDNNFKIHIPANKLFSKSQIVESRSKHLTFVGTNGCGKSALLEAILSSSLKLSNYKIISFASGQNELFSDIFKRIQSANRAAFFNREANAVDFEIFDSPIKSFHFNYQWVRILIFFAYVFKREGKTAEFINENIKPANEPHFELNLGVNFKIDWISATKIRVEQEREANGTYSDYLHSTFFEKVRLFVEYLIEPDCTFETSIPAEERPLNAEIASMIFYEHSANIALNCFAYGNEFFNLGNTNLYLGNWELRDLSDGEFQLLAIYALTDLFDSENTVFLLDEVDSHLHFKNIGKLWTLLNNTIGFIFSTTHIVDSIVLSKIENIRLIESGRVENEAKLNELMDRLESLSDGEEQKKKIASQIEYLALVEDKTDWIIFTTLAKKRLGDGYDSKKMDKVHFVKCESGYAREGDDFGGSKKDWVKDFSKINSDMITKEVFLICDRAIVCYIYS